MIKEKHLATIFVIEDNSDLLFSLISILQHFGYEAIGVTHPTHIDFREFDDRRPDLFLMDVMLGGSDGRSLVRELKKYHSTRNTPVIMMSAFPKVEDSVFSAGADDFIPKPFSLDELLSKIEHYLNSHESDGDNHT